MSKQRDTVTGLLHSLVKASPQGAAMVADLGGHKYTVLMNQLVKNGDHKLDADDVIPLALLTRPELVGKYIAGKLGGLFVPLPDEEVQMESELMRSLAATIREFGELASTSADGFADGIVEGHELSDIDDKASAAITAILTMKELAKRAHKEQFPKEQKG